MRILKTTSTLVCLSTLLLVLAISGCSNLSAGLKAGAFIPLDQELPSRFTWGLDARVKVAEHWKVGAELQLIDDVTGKEYQFNKEVFSYLGSTLVPTSSALDFYNSMLMIWYYPEENMYLGMGYGSYKTLAASQKSGWFEDTYKARPNDTIPKGEAVQINFGYMAKKSWVGQMIPFAEVKLLYQRGEGTMETVSGTRQDLKNFSGVAFLVGLATF